MQVFNTNIALKEFIAECRANHQSIGFVPTMGSLHKGHELLIKTSKKLCKKTLVSIFVNPTQFNNKDDYITYPRNLNKDLKILKRLKVDFVYLPTVNQIYKNKNLPVVTNSTRKIDKTHIMRVIEDYASATKENSCVLLLLEVFKKRILKKGSLSLEMSRERNLGR